jgi:sporulation protein YlmC with PRC-barrel domain
LNSRVVSSKDGQRVGDVEAVEFDETSRRIVRITLRRGFLFAHETSIPASLVESITDRIVLRTGTEAVRKLGRSPSDRRVAYLVAAVNSGPLCSRSGSSFR